MVGGRGEPDVLLMNHILIPILGSLSKMQNKAFSSFFIALLLLLTFCSCARERDKTVTICGNSLIDRSSTADGTNFFSNALEDLIFSPLAGVESEYKIHPVLIERATPVAGGGSWDITLKEGVRFHNGMPLTAEDVAFSIEKRKEISSSLRAIRKCDVSGERDIRLMLDRPFSDISDLLTNVYVYPRRIFRPDEPWKKTLLKNPIGSGPFRFKRWMGKGIELAAYEGYFEGRPKVDRVIYLYEENEAKRLANLLKGAADILTPLSPEAARFLEKDTRFYVNNYPVPYYAALFLNNQSSILSDRDVRKALNVAIDRSYIIDRIERAGFPVYGPFSRDMLPDGYNTPEYSYDPKGAAELLRDDGWKDTDGDGILDKKKKRLGFRLYYFQGLEELKTIADMISRQLFEIGIEVGCKPVTDTEFMGVYFPSGDYDALLTDMGIFSPEITWQSKQIHGSRSYNFSHYSNKEVDSLFSQAGKTSDPKEIKRIYGEIDGIMHKDSPAVFLYNAVSYSVASRRFKGAEKFRDTPYDFFRIKD